MALDINLKNKKCKNANLDSFIVDKRGCAGSKLMSIPGVALIALCVSVPNMSNQENL